MKDERRELELGVDETRFPTLDEASMETIGHIDCSSLTPMSIFQVAFFCDKAHCGMKKGPTVPVICDNLLFDDGEGKAHMSSELAICLARHWPMPKAGEEPNLPDKAEWKPEWTQLLDPLSIAGEKTSIEINQRFWAASTLENEETVVQSAQSTGMPNFCKMRLNGISASILMLFMVKSTVCGKVGETDGDQKPLSGMCPRHIVAPTAANCRRIEDMKRIQNVDEKDPGMMETIGGRCQKSFATEKHCLLPHWVRVAKEEDHLLEESRLHPTHDGLDTECKDWVQLHAMPMGNMGKTNLLWERFHGRDFGEHCGKKQSPSERLPRNQKNGMCLGLILEDLQAMLHGLREDGDWIRLHNHCSQMAPRI